MIWKKTPQSLIEQRVSRTGLPHKLNEKLKYKSVWFGILDWIAGILVAGWALLLGAVLRILYVTITEGYNTDKIFQFWCWNIKLAWISLKCLLLIKTNFAMRNFVTN